MESTITAPKRKKEAYQERPIPPLFNGDHLTWTEFERRYAAQPDLKKAELINGIVYIASPAHLPEHSKPHSRIVGWLFNYVAATPGTDFSDNAIVRLDWENKARPDAFLRLLETAGGMSQFDETASLVGVPELIVEVAASGVSFDLYEKLGVYRRNGVQEYMVLLSYEQETRWFQLVEGEYILMEPDEDGVIRSQVFPGLHFHSEMFWNDDLAGLLKVLQAGLDSPEHQAFTAELQARQTDSLGT